MSVQLTLNVRAGDGCQEDAEDWIEPAVQKLQEQLKSNVRARDGELLIDVLEFHFASGETCSIHVRMTGHLVGTPVDTEYHVTYFDQPRSIWDWILNPGWVIPVLLMKLLTGQFDSSIARRRDIHRHVHLLPDRLLDGLPDELGKFLDLRPTDLLIRPSVIIPILLIVTGGIIAALSAYLEWGNPVKPRMAPGSFASQLMRTLALSTFGGVFGTISSYLLYIGYHRGTDLENDRNGRAIMAILTQPNGRSLRLTSLTLGTVFLGLYVLLSGWCLNHCFGWPNF